MRKVKEQKISKKSDIVSCQVEQNGSSNNSFLKELQGLINKHSKENASNTPDFILAQYLNNCLTNFNLAEHQRSDWYSG